MARPTKVLVDTCVLLDDPDVLVRIRKKGGLPFLTSTVLDELDFNKSGRSEISANARLIFREFSRESSNQLEALPTAEPLLGSDILTRFSFKEGPVFLVAREKYRSQSNNDAKIIELAKDYEMVLVTRDNGMKVRAEALGVKAFLWTGPEENAPNTPDAKPRQGTSPGKSQPPEAPASRIRPFAICTTPLDEPDSPVVVKALPRSGEVVRLASGGTFRLGREIKSGGEGVIFETELAGQVCKVYHSNRLTRLKQKKIELMVSRRISRPGICWPTETVTNAAGEFVGYIMPLAHGETMQSAMFVKPKLEKTFPNWTRRDLVNIAGTFIDHVAFLHAHNIIIGDINPQNLLVTGNSDEVWMVDTDSFQIEAFPCPVGTVNFTAAEVQGRNYTDFLRTVDHELFAVATMIFMILFPGKPPYSQQGGGSPAENIKSKNFPYRFYKDAGPTALEVTGKDAPQGPWQYIWANLPVPIRSAFFSTFREDSRTTVHQWISLLVNYRDRLARGAISNELFPQSFPVRDPVQALCGKCVKSFTASQKYVDKLAADAKQPWCPPCTNRFRVEKLARQSQWTAPTDPVKSPSQGHRSPPSSGGTRSATTHRPASRTPPRTPPRSSSIPPQAKKPASTAKSSQQPSTLGGVFVSILKSLFK